LTVDATDGPVFAGTGAANGFAASAPAFEGLGFGSSIPAELVIGPSVPEGSVLADLHTHTTLSDGSDSFAEVAHRASLWGVSYVAFTNHDTLVASALCRDAAAPYGVVGIPGIEISAWDPIDESKAHILGYGFTSEKASAIEQLCAPIRAARHEASLAQMAKLEGCGYELDSALVARLASDSGCIFKQHIMAALTVAPFESDEYQNLYRRLFKGEGICAGDGIGYPDAREAVEAIRQSGGIAVLAHPGEFDNYAFVSYLVDVGLTGIEKYHPRHNSRDWEKVDQLAHAYGLVCTGGSDYHGGFGSPASPGAHHVMLQEDDPFLVRIAS
jgi:predicted metal-dependent phosphoesterase TrpH